MIDLHVVRKDNTHLYGDVLDQYFRARHEVYVKERGWRALDRPDGREIDQFDTEQAVYLIALDGSRVVGGHRLVPTSAPTLMSDVFPHLAMRGLVRSDDIYELSRIFVIKPYRGERAPPAVESLVLAGTMEFGLAEGIREFTIVMETWWVPRLQEIGWKVRPLGVSMDVEGMDTIGVAVEVDEASWLETRARRSVPGPVLVWQGVEAATSRLGPPRRRAG